MELVDVLSPSGEPTGAIVSRNILHSNGLWHKTVHVWIRNHAGELLLQKRSESKESHPGLWDISCAGHVSSGDSSRGAAVREMREELGISIDENALHHIFTVSQQYKNEAIAYVDNEIVDVYLCKVPIDAQELAPDPAEVSDISYFPVNLLKNSVIEKNDRFVPHEEEYRLLFEELSLKFKKMV